MPSGKFEDVRKTIPGSVYKLRGRQLAAESPCHNHTLRRIAVDIDEHEDEPDVNGIAIHRNSFAWAQQDDWRARHCYMLIDNAFTELSPTDSSVCTLSPRGWVLEGVFSAIGLVHGTEFGPFPASRIVSLESGKTLSERRERTAEPVESGPERTKA